MKRKMKPGKGRKSKSVDMASPEPFRKSAKKPENDIAPPRQRTMHGASNKLKKKLHGVML